MDVYTGVCGYLTLCGCGCGCGGGLGVGGGGGLAAALLPPSPLPRVVVVAVLGDAHVVTVLVTSCHVSAAFTRAVLVGLFCEVPAGGSKHF
jgi:hypothetical protein